MSRWLRGVSEQQLTQLYEERDFLSKACGKLCELWRDYVYHFHKRKEREDTINTKLQILQDFQEKVVDIKYHEERLKTIDEMIRLAELTYNRLNNMRDAEWIINNFLIDSKMDSLTYSLEILTTDGRMMELQRDYASLLGEFEDSYHKVFGKYGYGKNYPIVRRLCSFVYIHAANPSFFGEIAKEPIMLYGDDAESWKIRYLGSRVTLIEKLGHDLYRRYEKREYFPGICWKLFAREPVKDMIELIRKRD